MRDPSTTRGTVITHFCTARRQGVKEKKVYCKFKEEALDCTLEEITLEEAVDLSYNRLQNE